MPARQGLINVWVKGIKTRKEGFYGIAFVWQK